MRKMIAIATLFFTVSLFGSSGADLASQLGLDASTKVTKQWERIFKSKRKMKKRGLDKLSAGDLSVLKEYLINNAADADSAESAGR